jgi:hypothetical protein
VNIFDFTEPKGLISASVFGAFFGTADSSRKIHQRLAPQYAYFSCWVLVATVSLFVLSGCGTYKEELASAKQQIEKQDLEIKKLAEQGTRLKEETSRLNESSKALSDKNTRMQRDLDDLNRAKATCSAENEEIKKKNKLAEDEIAALRKEKATLIKEIEELKKRVADTVPSATPPAAVPTQGSPLGTKQLKEASPCEAVFAFMNASEGIIRQQKGEERTKSLEKMSLQYAPKMKGAPEKAIKAAGDWVKEFSKSWDKTDADSVFRLVQLRNIVSKACGK